MNMDGSAAHEVRLGWLHGWSPDAKYLVYAGIVDNNADIYRVSTDGSGELRMTTDKAEDDGPEYSADGKWIYFCSKRSGKWDAWRMPADGAGPDDKLAEKITKGRDTRTGSHTSLQMASGSIPSPTRWIIRTTRTLGMA